MTVRELLSNANTLLGCEVDLEGPVGRACYHVWVAPTDNGGPNPDQSQGILIRHAGFSRFCTAFAPRPRFPTNRWCRVIGLLEVSPIAPFSFAVANLKDAWMEGEDGKRDRLPIESQRSLLMRKLLTYLAICQRMRLSVEFSTSETFGVVGDCGRISETVAGRGWSLFSRAPGRHATSPSPGVHAGGKS